MCIKVTCDKCNKPTYKGCGRHIEDVLNDVPKEDRCMCEKKDK